MKTLLMIFTVITWLGLTSGASPIDVGTRIPNVGGIDQDGNHVDFRKAASTDFVLVYFYPKADTPGCTAQACSLRDAYMKLHDKGVRVFGVSMDSPEAQTKFRAKYNLPFTLIADERAKVIEAFGVPRTFGFANRQAFLFHDGMLVWRDLKASTKEQANDVLRVLEHLQHQ